MNPSDKQAVLQSLNRLSDNHTRKKAWDELTARADRLDGHTIGPFLLCLHNTTAQHTLPCRCGAVRMYAHLAGIQPTLLPPHLPRIADVLVARLKDKDATRELREACAAAAAALVTELDQESTFAALLRPLLPLLTEPSEPHQIGAAVCLGAAISAAGELGDALTQKVAAPLLKTLGHPMVGSHAVLLDAATSLVSRSPYSTRSLAPALLSAALAGASSAEWSARRSAAELLRAFAVAHVEAAVGGRGRLMPALQLLRADKNKSVRESALEALAAARAALGEPPTAPGTAETGDVGVAEPGAVGAARKPRLSDVRQQLRQQAAAGSPDLNLKATTPVVILAPQAKGAPAAPQPFPSFSLQPPSPLRERTPGERPTELHLTAMLPSGDFSMLAAPQAYSDSEGADPLEDLDDDDGGDEAHEEGALEGLHGEVYEGEAPYDDEAFVDEAAEEGSSCTEAGGEEMEEEEEE